MVYLDVVFYDGLLTIIRADKIKALSFCCPIRLKSSMANLSNLVLGSQGSTPAQDTGARMYWDRTVPGKAFGWILSLSQGGSCEDVGDMVTLTGKLHGWSHQLCILEVGSSLHPAWRMGSYLMELSGLLFPLLQSTTFGLFFLIKRKFSFLSFLSWQVP